jgi:phosphoribosylaminoimidazolecarboxamide formyltransferase / IMP cyclohydrolase
VRALLSAYDKTGIAAFARGLADLGWDLVASGGTASHLEAEGLEVTRVEALTGFAEMLGHRVVTLHPAVHGGILARRGVAEDMADLDTHGIAPFDLVCVNLYPFEQTVAALDVTHAEAIEKIDVGGPAMLRGAAKNHADVLPLCRPEDYDIVLEELRRDGAVAAETRRQLAARAFATTAAYDAAVATWLGGEAFPDTLVPVFDRALELSYGENPHQRAAYYTQRGARTQLLSSVEQRHGKPLSFNNLNDLSAARGLAAALDDQPACVIVKHANPCGVAVAATIEEAYAKALAADPISAYGGVVVLTRGVSAALGEALAEQFVEVLLAPSYDDEGLEALVRKPATRILEGRERRLAEAGELDYKRVAGGLLVQERDAAPDERAGMTVACGEVDDTRWADALFACAVVRHVVSNAIVIARNGQTLGIGGGQVSRVDAVRLAVEKAREHGHSLEGATLASDAFFPFADGVQLALEAGVVAVIQPGGSKRDAEVIAAVEAAGAAMVFTGQRHFRH